MAVTATAGAASKAPEYWEQVGRELRHNPRDSVWRNYCDTINRNWLLKHIPRRQVATALKTDLYDEAVGEGVFSLLRTHAKRVYGIDLAANTCCRAVERFPALHAIVCDVRKLPLTQASLGLVVSLSTMDHFESAAMIENALAAVYESLQPGGCLLMTLDNLSNPCVRLRNSLPWKVLHSCGLVPYRTGVTVTCAQLRRMLARVGFTVEHTGHLLHLPRVFGVLLARTLDRVGPPAGEWFCRLALPWELLGHLPTPSWTGYYTTATASKRPLRQDPNS